jgi:alpha-D-xyloside xylohydrolase
MIKCKLLLTNLFLLFALNKASASIISYQKTNDGVNFTLDKGKMFIGIIGDDLVEVKYTNLSAMPEKKSLVVLHSASFKKSFSVS